MLRTVAGQLCTTSEHDMYPALLTEVAKDMLAMADRGFFSYQAWKDSAATGAALLWRMKANSVLPVAEELGDDSYRSAVYPSSKDRAKDTNGIPVRVIEYEVTTAKKDGGEEVSTFRLITSILDPLAAPAQDLAGLYARRWEIESSFDELKTHQRGPDIVLRSKTPDGVLQEIYGYLCTHYAIRSLIGTVAAEFEEDPMRFSFIRTLRAAKRSLAGRPAFSPSQTSRSLRRLLSGNPPRIPAPTPGPQLPPRRQTQNVQPAAQTNTKKS